MAIVILGLQIKSNAQIPNYVPTNGLVGWWPFNGNANDESINGNNGIVNGATLTNDRFGISNSSYNFNGINNFIQIQPNTSLTSLNGAISICAWVYCEGTTQISSYSNQDLQGIFGPSSYLVNDGGFLFRLADDSYDQINNRKYNFGVSLPSGSISSTNIINDNLWDFVVASFDGSSLKIYRNGELDVSLLSEASLTQAMNTIDRYYTIGQCIDWLSPSVNYQPFYGKLDDIGIWNRALTQQEITDLYNATNCSNNLTISPATNQLEIGSTANFVATTSDPNPSFIWQSDLGQGFQTLNNYGNYSGVNTNSLSISNVQLSENNQPIRVISTSGECIDTSNVATINITDTCIVTINDTITTLISVTDTLIINTLITGLTPPNNSNTIKVFPNPANSHITIDFGNFESMNGYTLTITNSIGQTVYTTPINEQSSYIDLSTWSGNGIYFVQIIDTLNNTIENRKIVLQ